MFLKGKGAKMKRRYKIKNKFKFSVFLMVIMLLMGSSFMRLSNAEMNPELMESNYTTIQVQSGDTLWTIAKAYGNPGTDPRKTIYEICEINQLDTKDIYPGQVLQIRNDF